MPSLFVVLGPKVAERKYLGFYAEVILSGSIPGVQQSPTLTKSTIHSHLHSHHFKYRTTNLLLSPA